MVKPDFAESCAISMGSLLQRTNELPLQGTFLGGGRMNWPRGEYSRVVRR
jgi:hypothetical protein